MTGTWTSSALWSVLKPRTVLDDLGSDLAGVVRALRDPGVFATRAPGSHVSRPIDVLGNMFTESVHNLRQTPAGAERVMVLVGDLDAARDLRFLSQHDAALGQAGAAVRGWTAGRGAVQVVDLGVVIDSITPKTS